MLGFQIILREIGDVGVFLARFVSDAVTNAATHTPPASLFLHFVHAKLAFVFAN